MTSETHDVIIIGAGLDRSGIMNVLSRYIILLAGKRMARIMTLLSATVALIERRSLTVLLVDPTHTRSV